jgi:hypothetical protein
MNSGRDQIYLQYFCLHHAKRKEDFLVPRKESLMIVVVVVTVASMYSMYSVRDAWTTLHKT